MKELQSKYNHHEVEKEKYAQWVKKGYYTAGDRLKKPFCAVLPPPNVTGMLHLGHAYNGTLQDVLMRYKRLKGYDVLWVPGMDHAGIATQAKIEKKLRDQGIDKYQLGREGFLKVAWEWKEEYATTIRKQWAKLGLSLDYSREVFTLDERRNEAVRKVFVTLYEKGYLYRKEKIINWDPVLKTALSNIEVVYKEIEGNMYYFRYYIENSKDYIIVGTTRPETMFGDVAVFVNPKDKRYQHLKGKKVYNPANGDLLPILFDEYVDIDFATGAMKCTPAHDPNDYLLGEKYHLEQIVCMNLDATMNQKAGQYEGMDRFACREALVETLKQKGLVEKIEKILHQVGHSERSDAIVEPTLSKQWFVSMKKLAQNTLNRQKGEDKVHFYPQRFEKVFTQWLENIEDWCVSRQLWWGHRIPAYYKKGTDEILVSYLPPKDIENYVQDEDVLDTWFSSALWPFTTLGWPENTPDFQRYYPNDLLVTAYDIIFFWVSRMMFEAIEFTDKIPFKDVLIHGLVRDEQGRKMSKSLGNGIDPMEVVDQYGADALRFFLVTNSAPGIDFRFSKEKISSSWNFINKIWNATRFVLMHLTSSFEVKELQNEKLHLFDQWILMRLNYTIQNIEENLEKYEFANVGSYLTSFIWNDFCSWYIELSKLNLNDSEKSFWTKQVLYYVLKSMIILLHPFVPFVSEELYQALPFALESIHLESFPIVNESFESSQVEKEMKEVMEIVTFVRNFRNNQNISNKTMLSIFVETKTALGRKIFDENKNVFTNFLNAKVSLFEKDMNIQVTDRLTTENAIYSICYEKEVHVEEEILKYEEELKRLEQEVLRCQKMLTNEGFLKKAPLNKINVEKEKLQNYISRKESVQKHLDELKKS